MPVDYSLFGRSIVPPDELKNLRFDAFISAFNDSDRVQHVWSSVDSDTKIWINHYEYHINDGTLPAGDSVHIGTENENEIDFWNRLLDRSDLDGFENGAKIGFDITGMMRPHLMVLPLVLRYRGYDSAFFLYSDPTAYSAGSGTKFSIGPVTRVSPVSGLEGSHTTSTEPADLLIIGAGYDDGLMQVVAEDKRAAEHVLLLGLPSLQPHMYQESQLRLHLARESIHNYNKRSHLYAPASNPFMTASVLAEYIADLRRARPDLNVYVSPLGPKTQVLGFAWYYLCECRDTATSVIFPYAESYSPETSKGIARTHVFDLELGSIEIDEGP